MKKIETGYTEVMLALRRWLTAVTLAAVTGCAGQGDGVATAVRRLSTALATVDGAAACELLAPDTRVAVAESAGASCPAAITGEGLTPPGAVRTVDVYGPWRRWRSCRSTSGSADHRSRSRSERHTRRRASRADGEFPPPDGQPPSAR
ncbi:hypothetical protein Adi01nite_03080 [Amorphoplanes digitatis]|uniref:Lipoprotein n=1 Tax=Actinoplanes digitatis TaxID=1868 RepID=A0A7W7HW03_9ACTN|nr:hypothetical protein [Actinoplanes digitatis]MBB4761785.1 hypothetical protein [Actinoplanes digitatis]BFE70424.1 hypothetical protein GCM10020092_037250 [Actinoplanes digitatis]GID90896.1 hypothetical protein Adi01nite_03080 [Actinoplanes digitatis]